MAYFNASGKSIAAQLTEEQSRRQQADAGLAAALAQVAALQAQLACAQTETRQHYTQLTALINRLPMGVLVVDADNRVQFINQTYRELFNLAAEHVGLGDIIGLEDDELATTIFQEPHSFLARARELRASGQPTLHEAVALADGRMLERDHLVLDTAQAGRLICYRDVTEHHQREDVLRTTSYIAEQDPNPIIRLTPAGEVIYTNPAAVPVWEALVANAAGGPLQELTTLVSHTLATGKLQQQELAVAGQQYLLKAVAVPGQAYATLYLVDITSRRETEQQLARQREFYESILENMPVGVSALNARHEYLYANSYVEPNPQVRRWMIGRSSAEVCACKGRSAAVTAERQQMFELALRERREVKWEEEINRTSGATCILRRKQPVYGADGELLMVLSTGVDISERAKAEALHRRSEEVVREQQAFIRQIVDSIPNVLLVTNGRDVTFSNAAYEAISVRCNHGKMRWDVDSPELREMKQLITWDRQVMETRQTVSEELAYTLATGETIYYHVYKLPLLRANGTAEVLTINTDITERILVERQLRHAKLAAESAVRAREMFLANMSHEIRTPMNAIMGMGQLLAKTPLTPAQASYQQAITTSADNLLVIINDILDLSKLEAGKMTLEQVGFAPAQLLAQLEQTLQYKAAEKGLCLSTQWDPSLPAVLLGDPYRITQVLLNLAGNAIKFTEKGHILVSCELESQTLDTDMGMANVLFRVLDTGVGIEPAFLAHIFQEFSQEDASVTRKFGGTGLGLSICRNLVKLMGGDLQLESKKQHGTVAHFTLPLPLGNTHDLLPPVLLPEDARLRQDLHHKHVLLVEDNRFNRQIAKTMLQQAQVRVTEAEHGAEALALLQDHCFDLILMDIQMPVLDGYAATAALRQLGLTTPIVALTANAIKGEQEKCLAAGMNDYLTKPFQEAQLLQMATKWVVPPAVELLTPPGPSPAPARPRLPPRPPCTRLMSCCK